jgi:regulatory protein
VARGASDRNRPPLDAAALDRLAIDYVARYATTRAKVRTYLQRKITERGWAGEGAPPLEAIVARLADLGFVDDKAFAVARSASLGRRGYGAHRVGVALRAAGIAADDAAPALEGAAEDAWSAAEAFAKRRRIGPFAVSATDPDQRRKALAAMLRAGHPMQIARAFIYAAPGEVPERDS